MIAHTGEVPADTIGDSRIDPAQFHERVRHGLASGKPPEPGRTDVGCRPGGTRGQFNQK